MNRSLISAGHARCTVDTLLGHPYDYCMELSQVHQMLDTRYDEIKSGRVKPVDGEEAFSRLRQKSQARRSS